MPAQLSPPTSRPGNRDQYTLKIQHPPSTCVAFGLLEILRKASQVYWKVGTKWSFGHNYIVSQQKKKQSSVHRGGWVGTYKRLYKYQENLPRKLEERKRVLNMIDELS